MENRYSEAIKLARMGVWSWDVITNETHWCPNKFILFGYEPNEFEVNLESAFRTVHPEDKEKILESLGKNLPTKDAFDYEYRGIKKNKEIIYVEVRVEVERDTKGKPLKVIGISQDITERKGFENKIVKLNNSLEQKVKIRTRDLIKKNDENEYLVKEMHHRVKNNLQIISSILKMQTAHITDERSIDILLQSVNRIKSIAIIHDSLYRQNNLNHIHIEKYVRQLFALHSYEKNNVSFTIDITDSTLSVNKMVPLGMLLNELISNSYEHAFVNNKAGTIELTIDLKDKLIIAYKDNGVGFNVANIKTEANFGIELIEVLSQDLDAEYRIKSSSGNGMEFYLTSQINK